MLPATRDYPITLALEGYRGRAPPLLSCRKYTSTAVEPAY